MQYWVNLKDKNGEPIFYYDYFLPGIISNHVLEMMLVRFVDEKLGICDGCESAYHCHVIEEGTGKKYCPILFCDVVKPSWKVEELV